MIRKLLATALVLGVGGVVIRSLPDLKRYWRIKQM